MRSSVVHPWSGNMVRDGPVGTKLRLIPKNPTAGERQPRPGAAPDHYNYFWASTHLASDTASAGLTALGGMAIGPHTPVLPLVMLATSLASASF